MACEGRASGVSNVPREATYLAAHRVPGRAYASMAANVDYKVALDPPIIT